VLKHWQHYGQHCEGLLCSQQPLLQALQAQHHQHQHLQQ
jgi:hypothetical protein